MTGTIADLVKGDVSGEKRDEDGKWTEGGGGSKKPDAATAHKHLADWVASNQVNPLSDESAKLLSDETQEWLQTHSAPMMLYRGVSESYFESLVEKGVGAEVTFRPYMSTSSAAFRGVAQRFGRKGDRSNTKSTTLEFIRPPKDDLVASSTIQVHDFYLDEGEWIMRGDRPWVIALIDDHDDAHRVIKLKPAPPKEKATIVADLVKGNVEGESRDDAQIVAAKNPMIADLQKLDRSGPRIDAQLDAHFSLAQLKLRTSPGSTRGVIRVLQDEWGLPLHKRRDDDDGTKAGDHGIDEIGRQEKAFYDALTVGQQAAYAAIVELVDQMYDDKVGWGLVDPWTLDEPMEAWKAKARIEIATHPAKAYMLGQMLASEKLKSPLHRPMLPTDSRAIQFLNNHAFNELDNSFDGLKGTLRSALINGISQGDNPKEVARKIANELKDYNTWWDVIAITETSRAESHGRLRELEDAGEEWCVGSSAHDSRTCDDCKALIDGKKYKVADILANNNYGKKRGDWVACIPCHPRI